MSVRDIPIGSPEFAVRLRKLKDSESESAKAADADGQLRASKVGGTDFLHAMFDGLELSLVAEASEQLRQMGCDLGGFGPMLNVDHWRAIARRLSMNESSATIQSILDEARAETGKNDPLSLVGWVDPSIFEEYDENGFTLEQVEILKRKGVSFLRPTAGRLVLWVEHFLEQNFAYTNYLNCTEAEARSMILPNWRGVQEAACDALADSADSAERIAIARIQSLLTDANDVADLVNAQPTLRGLWPELRAAIVAASKHPAQTTPPGATGREPNRGQEQRPNLREPSEVAMAVYRYWAATGKTQTELATDPELMKVLGRDVSQGTISRYLTQVREWLEKGNVLPPMNDIPRRNAKPMDPSKIELGGRQDGRTAHQRPKRDDK